MQSASTSPGVLFIVCGPSGVGKSTLCERLLSEFSTLDLSISFTTRAPRGSEQNGVDYHFVSIETFENMIEQGAFAEYAKVHRNYYGTAHSTVSDALQAGRDVLFDIDYQGAQQLRKAFGRRAYSTLLLPPSMRVLERRLRARQTDSPEVIEGRLKAARHEIAQFADFDFGLVNNDLEETYLRFRSVYIALRSRIDQQRELIEALLQDRA